ncbi:hypothetical protein ALO_07733 [Acetonema longum DSM 6540]|uniref:Uncharacterized protein n=1 Tax=Acetonema longum DSM 6540 TaxID=1009370 RepID=F7NHJ9_9FIRM|nr:hypothetical protein ALO_07733 [Acetonema longum DSM 6540]
MRRFAASAGCLFLSQLLLLSKLDEDHFLHLIFSGISAEILKMPRLYKK